ncbi:hypothetical protein ACIA8G_26830 [Lentzea sp. NPDC051213]|uniref:hypothetical protein n=1 Tax=Lentzea sp. NPDC051213 TaxID=3364126 RepID=UPI00378D2B12
MLVARRGREIPQVLRCPQRTADQPIRIDHRHRYAQGEALALHWADIPLDEHVLSVLQTLSNINNSTPVFTTLKIKSSLAWVGLSNRVVSVRQNQAERHSTLSTTTEIYGHLLRHVALDAVKAIETALKEAEAA